MHEEHSLSEWLVAPFSYVGGHVSTLMHLVCNV
jgi:hypothetical protein